MEGTWVGKPAPRSFFGHDTTFKCVGIYEDIPISGTIKIYNEYSSNTVVITSTAGNKFYFDTGRTTLVCDVTSSDTNLVYYWAYRTSNDNFIIIEDNHTKSL